MGTENFEEQVITLQDIAGNPTESRETFNIYRLQVILKALNLQGLVQDEEPYQGDEDVLVRPIDVYPEGIFRKEFCIGTLYIYQDAGTPGKKQVEGLKKAYNAADVKEMLAEPLAQLLNKHRPMQ